MTHNENGRPRSDNRETASEKNSGSSTLNTMVARSHVEVADLALIDDHGAINAADATPWFNREVVEAAVCRLAATGRTFAADDLIDEHPNLPDIGNGLGGVFMSLHRAGVIRRVGYRPSTKPSRAGGVVATWAAGDRA